MVEKAVDIGECVAGVKPAGGRCRALTTSPQGEGNPDLAELIIHGPGRNDLNDGERLSEAMQLPQPSDGSSR